MRSDHIFYYFVAVLSGIFFGFEDWWISAIVLVILFTILWKYKIKINIVVFGLIYLFGGIYSGMSIKKPPTESCFIGTVLEQRQSKKISYAIIKTENVSLAVKDIPKYYQIGSKLNLCIFGEVKWMPVMSSRPFGFFQFSKIEYFGQDSSLYFKILNISQNSRDFLLTRIRRYITEPYAGFISGLVWSGDVSLSNYWQEVFRKSGVSHIVAVSGFNITILFLASENILKFLAWRYRFGISVLLSLLVAALAGFGVPVIRSCLMTYAARIMQKKGMQSDIERVLLLFVFIFSLFDPIALRYDASLHLSVLALWGVVRFSDYFKEKLNIIPNWYSLRENLAGTISASIFTIPYGAYNFSGLSLISFVANLVILPMIPILMLLAVICVFLPFDGLPNLLIFGLNFLPAVAMKVIEKLSQIPYAYFSW